MPCQRIFAKPSLVDRVWLYTSVSRQGWRNFGNPHPKLPYKVFSISKLGTWFLWWKCMWMILHDDLALNCFVADGVGGMFNVWCIMQLLERIQMHFGKLRIHEALILRRNMWWLFVPWTTVSGRPHMQWCWTTRNLLLYVRVFEEFLNIYYIYIYTQNLT